MEEQLYDLMNNLVDKNYKQLLTELFNKSKATDKIDFDKLEDWIQEHGEVQNWLLAYMYYELNDRLKNIENKIDKLVPVSRNNTQ